MKFGKVPERNALVHLALGVEGIIDEFGWLGFSKPEDVSVVSAQEKLPAFEDSSEAANQEIDNTDWGRDGNAENMGEDLETFEREDIEIGIDRLISQLIKKRLIDKEKAGRQPTLSRVFSIFYGESHPILKLVESFEHHIKGYFGTIGYEEMEFAFQDILEVEKLIKRDLGAMGD